MAMKLGAENRRNVIIAGALFCVLLYLGVSQLIGGPSPAPRVATPPPQPVTVRNGDREQTTSGQPASTQGAEAKKRPGTGLDPSLHLDKLMASEGVEYAGSGRNIFSADSAPAPVPIPEVKGPARPEPDQVAVNAPPPVPQPPSIDLRYFGYTATHDGKKRAFFVHGDDVFEAYTGDIVNHRYKVLNVDIHSVQVTDLSYNNTQTLQLVAN